MVVVVAAVVARGERVGWGAVVGLEVAMAMAVVVMAVVEVKEVAAVKVEAMAAGEVKEVGAEEQEEEEERGVSMVMVVAVGVVMVEAGGALAVAREEEAAVAREARVARAAEEGFERCTRDQFHGRQSSPLCHLFRPSNLPPLTDLVPSTKRCTGWCCIFHLMTSDCVDLSRGARPKQDRADRRISLLRQRRSASYSTATSVRGIGTGRMSWAGVMLLVATAVEEVAGLPWAVEAAGQDGEVVVRTRQDRPCSQWVVHCCGTRSHPRRRPSSTHRRLFRKTGGTRTPSQRHRRLYYKIGNRHK